jgi:F420-non-reducing hydrogenase large subunit
MGLVDENNKVNFYDGKVRVVDPSGKELIKYGPDQYLDVVAEHIEPWTYLKFPYLKQIGWKGFVDGPDSGVYRTSPLSRLNASDGMATPLAQAEYEKYFKFMGGKPVHQTLATHWARLIETLYAAERALELATDPMITSKEVRTISTETPTEVWRS